MNNSWHQISVKYELHIFTKTIGHRKKCRIFIGGPGSYDYLGSLELSLVHDQFYFFLRWAIPGLFFFTFVFSI